MSQEINGLSYFTDKVNWDQNVRCLSQGDSLCKHHQDHDGEVSRTEQSVGDYFFFVQMRDLRSYYHCDDSKDGLQDPGDEHDPRDGLGV